MDRQENGNSNGSHIIAADGLMAVFSARSFCHRLQILLKILYHYACACVIGNCTHRTTQTARISGIPWNSICYMCPNILMGHSSQKYADCDYAAIKRRNIRRLDIDGSEQVQNAEHEFERAVDKCRQQGWRRFEAICPSYRLRLWNCRQFSRLFFAKTKRLFR